MTLFLDLRHCWRHGPLGDILGLDWSQALAMVRLRGDGRWHWRRLREGLQAMEQAVLATLSEKR